MTFPKMDAYFLLTVLKNTEVEILECSKCDAVRLRCDGILKDFREELVREIFRFFCVIYKYEYRCVVSNISCSPKSYMTPLATRVKS
jgi:hypothetical protein